MNVDIVYKEKLYDLISVNEIDSASVVKEMIDVRDGSVKCEIFNIDDERFIINDLCSNYFILQIYIFTIFIVKMCE